MIETFQKSQLAELKQWWTTGVPFVEEPTESWCEHVCEKEYVHCFCSVQGGRITVYSQTDQAGGIAHIAVVTNPLLLRCGHATTHLREVEQRLAVLGVRKLIAAIETDNQASIALFERNGYNRVECDKWERGFLDYEKSIQHDA